VYQQVFEQLEEEHEGSGASAAAEDVCISYATIDVERQTKNGNASFLLYNESFPCWMTNGLPLVDQSEGFGSQAKWHVRVSKQSCKQRNRLILWGVGAP
jgi:hypothetical protein